MENKEIFEILDTQAKVLVGILLKRVELLEKEQALAPNLYKSLVREHVYEWIRTVKTLINGRLEFRSKPKQE